MGNREDLLAGAKRCLLREGLRPHHRARHRPAAGVSLAAIGYHYGTKEALLSAALLNALEDWGEEIGAMMAAETDPAYPGRSGFEAAWAQVIRSFAENRQLWRIQFELLAQLDRDPVLQKTFADANRAARLALATPSAISAAARTRRWTSGRPSRWARSTTRCSAASRQSGWSTRRPRSPDPTWWRRCGCWRPASRPPEG